MPYLREPVQFEDLQLQVGGGISARWQQQQLQLGSAAFCQVSAADMQRYQAQVYLSLQGQLLCALTLSDQLRPEVAQLVPALKAAQLKLAILTGDSSAAAGEVASRLHIEQLYQGCTPEQKVEQIRAAVAQGETVLMVGDGINDSPCFHAAHVSVALDSGTELSKNQADVVLLHNDLSQLQLLIAGARQAKAVIRQNLWWAALYNLVIIPLAVCGFVSPYVAVIGMSFSSLLVVSNSLRLLKI